MQRSLMLQDGTPILVRPYLATDMDASFRFYQKISQEERRFLRIDVSQREVLERQFHDVMDGKAVRLIALADGEIAGMALVELSPERWDAHRGELRVSVAPAFRGKGLGKLLIADLFRAAKAKGLQRMVARFVPEQRSIRALLEELGWRVDAVLPGYVRDLAGETHDQVVMSCNLDECYEAMAADTQSDNWPDG